MAHATWTFLTNHAQVLLFVARNQHTTARKIAASVGITERAVQRLLDDLEAEGYIHRAREGRGNRYEVNLDRPLRHPAQRGQPVRELLDLLLAFLDRADPTAPAAANAPSPAQSAPTMATPRPGDALSSDAPSEDSSPSTMS